MTNYQSEIRVPDYTYKVRVDRVIDGDTVDVSIDVGFKTNIFKRLRLLEVDTEELRSKDIERRLKAREAKTFVEDRILNNENVMIKTYWDSTGKYGRVLAWIFYKPDGVATDKYINLNEELVEKGFQKI